MASRNYKFVRVSVVAYQKVFQDVFNAIGEDAPYDDMLKTFFKLSLVYSDTVPRELEALGNEAHEIILNGEVFQKRWAEENGVNYDPGNWKREILLAQLDAIRPDVVYIMGITHPEFEVFFEDGFRERIDYVKAVAGYACFIEDVETAKKIKADCIISCVPEVRSYFIRAGIPTELVYHGFDVTILDNIDKWRAKQGMEAEPGKTFDFTFVGQTGFSTANASSYTSRYWHLVHLILANELEVWGWEKADWLEGMDGCIKPREHENQEQIVKTIKQVRQAAEGLPPAMIVNAFQDILHRLTGHVAPQFSLRVLFPEHFHDAVHGVEMFDILSRSRITFNRHVGFMLNAACVGNMRMFEATGVGACLVNESGVNMRVLFEEDREIVTYDSPEEAVEKVKYLVDHPDECRAIAEAGRARTLRDHTTAKRCAEIHEVLADLLD